ncbi:tetratricopeptide repeat protein [Sorangium sp. So ce1000]|uniref:tetratricopeptide repeat protein n=1 Tax=Sorangium sp. So ce1000 TaxID=3133325 RepID=UPI003F60722F
MVASAAMERRELDGLTREELIARAEGLGVPRPRLLTKAELVDEIVARTAQSEPERARLRGFLGRARDLLSRVVERGLHMPETARALRGEAPPEQWPPPPPPPPPRSTMTLAEIYAAQGHTDRAIAVLDEILARAPEDEDARRLRERLIERASHGQGTSEEARGADADAEDADAEDADAEDADAEDADADADDANAEDAGAEDAGAEDSGVGDADAGAEDSGAEDAGAEDSDADAKDTDAEHVDRPDADVEVAGGAAADASPAPFSQNDGSGDPHGAAIANEAEGRPGPVTGAPDHVPAQPSLDPSPAGAEALASSVASGASPGLVAALHDERAALPVRYDVDEIVGIAVDPETLYLYWEVRPRTLARARARRPEGQLAIRLVAVLPSWERPVVEQRDLAIDALFGDMFVRDIPSGAHLRMCTGWLAGEVFEPFAVGLEVAVPRALPAAPRPSSEEPPASAPALTGETSGEPPASAPALTSEVPGGSATTAINVAGPRLEGDSGEAPAAVSGASGAGAASLAIPGASGGGGEPVVVAGASGDPETTALPAPGAPAASRDAEVEAAAAAAVTSGDVEAAVPAASGGVAMEAARATPSSGLEAIAAAQSAAHVAEPALASSDEAPRRFPSGTAPTPDAIAQAVAATRGAASEGPARFPSGTAPTPEAIAQAVAATRGGSSELSRGSGGRAGPGRSGPPHASEALRRTSVERGPSPGGGPRTGADRVRSLGGGAELWRSFAARARPPSGGR